MEQPGPSFSFSTSSTAVNLNINSAVPITITASTPIRYENVTQITPTLPTALTYTSQNYSPEKLVVGICGMGTVGSGLVDLIMHKTPHIYIKKILIKDLIKHSNDHLPKGCTFAKSFDEILYDAEINCVIELIGGSVGLAKEVVFKSIENGKHVITGNKALISLYLNEIEALVTSQYGAVSFQYETAVCGGIPIVSTIKRGFSGDTIISISGIMNGTTNYMLTQMEENLLSYGESLDLAKEKGYAEADPTADVQGHDVRSKLLILTKLCFGKNIKEHQIYCQGIGGITPEDFKIAKSLGYTIKLLGMTKLNTITYKNLSVLVTPCFVKLNNSIAQAHNATNIVEIISSNLGQTIFMGAGAGKYPSANSAFSDLLELEQTISNTPTKPKFFRPFPKEPKIELTVELQCQFEYIIRYQLNGKLFDEVKNFVVDLFKPLTIDFKDHFSRKQMEWNKALVQTPMIAMSSFLDLFSKLQKYSGIKNLSFLPIYDK